MLNTALILHLLAHVQHLIHGRHFHSWLVFDCFESVKVRHASTLLDRRIVCGLIKVSQHSVTMTWR